MDMMFHKLKPCDLVCFALKPEAITLMLVGLAEIHANAEMFGGLDSTSFKIKFKHIDVRGRQVFCIMNE